jgi:hypothetical protein
MAAYSDLLRALLDDEVGEIRGTPQRVVRGDRVYWYDAYRVGGASRKRYLGEESEALLARIAGWRELAAEREARAGRRAKLVRVLQAEGMTRLDRETGDVLNALAAAGAFRVGGVLVGTVAFRLYEGELGIPFASEDVAQTQDVDVASFERLSVAIGDAADPGVIEALGELDFSPAPNLDPGRSWRLRRLRSDMLVEFLTPSFRDDEDVRDLPALGVSAQSLHFLNFLIAEPIHAAALYRQGILVRIPRPEAFAVHKLIVADRRRAEADRGAKRRKDLLQARRLIELLREDKPDLLKASLEDALSRGPSWRRHLEASRTADPEVRRLLEGL